MSGRHGVEGLPAPHWIRTKLSWLAVGLAVAVVVSATAPARATGPATGMHYTANSNFSGSHYLPGADGFNLADVSGSWLLRYLPVGVRALVWVGQCNGADSTFVSTVTPFVGKSQVFGYYLMDEPDPSGRFGALCPAGNLKAESDWIHAHDPGKKTFIIAMNMASSLQPSYANTYNPTDSDIDLYGLDPYPCRSELGGCDFSYVSHAVTAAESAGIPQADIVPVYQAFGGGSYVDDGGGSYLLPTVAQEAQLLLAWAVLTPSPVFDYAYSWGTQDGDQALSGSSALQQVFLAHNVAH